MKPPIKLKAQPGYEKMERQRRGDERFRKIVKGMLFLVAFLGFVSLLFWLLGL